MGSIFLSFFRTLFQIKIETTGSIFRHETTGLLPSLTTSEKPISLSVLPYIHVQINGLFAVALVLEATLASSTGKLETLGSSFRHETAGLLPSFATAR